jgi:hypothetical protein
MYMNADIWNLVIERQEHLPNNKWLGMEEL